MGRKKKETFDVSAKDVVRAETDVETLPTTELVNPLEKMKVMRDQTSLILREYDEQRRKNAEDTGESRPESMADVWTEACDQQDTNEILRNYMMQLHVMFQELFQDVYKFNKKCNADNDKLLTLYEKTQDGNDLKEYVKAKRYSDKQRLDMVSGIESMARTIKGIAQEYRQGEMTKALYYHISEVRSSQALIIATLKQLIPDQSILNQIADALEDKFKLIGRPNGE